MTRTEKERLHHREYMKKWRKEHPEYVVKHREAVRRYEESDRFHRKYNPILEKKRREKFKEKNTARQILNRCIRSGDVVRGKCNKCGSSDAQAHHQDYSKPLEVIWLCALHHSEIHHLAYR